MTQRVNPVLVFYSVMCLLLWMNPALTSGSDTDVKSWKAAWPRDEIKPQFVQQADAARKGSKDAALIITSDKRLGLQGYWTRSFKIEGGRNYVFTAYRKTTGIEFPARSCVVKLTWQDDKGKLVPGGARLLRPLYPRDGATDNRGWTKVSQIYTAPDKATHLRAELHLRWAPGGKVIWSDVSVKQTRRAPGRKVRLAAVHLRPRNSKGPEDNRKQFAPLIEKAASQKADLVCLPECLTLIGTGLNYAEASELVPGPSTKYFGELAKKHKLYIVAGILERKDHLVYNTAVLLGPEGKLIGKYRKVCLPREEIKGGVTPGKEYPVFDTRFGKLGIMICWDVHFPEVARNLSHRGAEVIAMPIWGGMPALAKARAIENQIHLLTSTYTDHDKDWMKTGVFGPDGKLIKHATEWSTVVVVEVDLDEPPHWEYIGDFRSRIQREKPADGFK